MFNETGDFYEKNKTVFDAVPSLAHIQGNDAFGEQNQGANMIRFIRDVFYYRGFNYGWKDAIKLAKNTIYKDSK